MLERRRQNRKLVQVARMLREVEASTPSRRDSPARVHRARLERAA